MAVFPALKTGAVAQYPAERHAQFSTTVLEFVDGREQRFREFGRMRRRWVIRLDQLDAGELEAIERFFEQTSPAAQFVFTDPWSGMAHRACAVENSELVSGWLAEGRGRTELVIREEGV